MKHIKHLAPPAETLLKERARIDPTLKITQYRYSQYGITINN